MKGPMRKRETTADVAGELAWFFRRNGYIRRQNARRAKREGWDSYKKGDEIRLVATSKAELARIRRLLRDAGFKLARPFAKGLQYRQPLYGRQTVQDFLSMIRLRRQPGNLRHHQG